MSNLLVSLCEKAVAKLCPTLCNPERYNPPGPSVCGFPGKNTGVGCHALLLGNLPHPGIKATSPASPDLADGFFTTESLGKSGLLSAYYLKQNLRHIF